MGAKYLILMSFIIKYNFRKEKYFINFSIYRDTCMCKLYSKIVFQGTNSFSSTPRHDPYAPNNLVMPRPSAAHQVSIELILKEKKG